MFSPIPSARIERVIHLQNKGALVLIIIISIEGYGGKAPKKRIDVGQCVEGYRLRFSTVLKLIVDFSIVSVYLIGYVVLRDVCNPPSSFGSLSQDGVPQVIIDKSFGRL